MNAESPAGGLALVAGGALLLSAKGIVVKVIFAYGVDIETLLLLRNALALPVLVAWALYRVGPGVLGGVERRSLIGAVLTGVICYYGAAMLDLYALTLIDASLERVLLFSYPAFVVFFHALASRSWPSTLTLAAIVLTYLGVALAVGVLRPDVLDSNLRGTAVAMLAAVLMAYYVLANERLVPRMGSQAFIVIVVAAATAVMSLHYLLLGDLKSLALPLAAWPWVVFLAVFVSALPLVMLAAGIHRIGAVRGALVSTVGPPATIVMAWVFLGERMGLSQLAGALLVVAGVLVLELGKLRPRDVAGPIA
ncbi:MAG: DMT family transporter [Gammaproteobacteria bacterium]|nr:DMT family transporter [Gammaproteobacteria bacterium]